MIQFICVVLAIVGVLELVLILVSLLVLLVFCANTCVLNIAAIDKKVNLNFI